VLSLLAKRSSKENPTIETEEVQPIVLEVQVKDAGTRLDSFLATCFEDISRATVQRWIREGSVKVNGTPRKSSYALSENERVEVIPLPASPPPELSPEAIPIEILYEDDDLVAVNKAAGMVVHPGAGNWTGTLANALLHHFSQMSQKDPLRPGIVHRLDKETSGVLLVAKNEFTHEALSRQFKERDVEKHYLALVYGHLEESSGKIDVPIGRDPRSRIKISTRGKRTREALTLYRVIQRFPGFTYVRAFPKTGRTHQIRVHFHHLGHPIVGDKLYGRAKSDKTGIAAAIKRIDRHFLHATFLSITHPITGKKIDFEAPLPNELEELLATLGE
jgi:23S rRNA pseudouridine1911/1915/1917 synthase